VKFARDRLPGARAARRVLPAVASAAMAAGIMAGTAGPATASGTGPAASTATSVMQPNRGCLPCDYRPECKTCAGACICDPVLSPVPPSQETRRAD
jgi:hypothetical protein